MLIMLCEIQGGGGASRKGRFAALFLENRPRKNLLFLLFRPLLLFFEGLFRVEIYKLEQNRADQLFYAKFYPRVQSLVLLLQKTHAF